MVRLTHTERWELYKKQEKKTFAKCQLAQHRLQMVEIQRRTLWLPREETEVGLRGCVGFVSKAEGNGCTLSKNKKRMRLETCLPAAETNPPPPNWFPLLRTWLPPSTVTVPPYLFWQAHLMWAERLSHRNERDLGSQFFLSVFPSRSSVVPINFPLLNHYSISQKGNQCFCCADWWQTRTLISLSRHLGLPFA